MSKRIVLIFCLLASLILPSSAATKGHRKHSVARSRKTQTKSKSVRKSTHRRTRTTASRRRAARARRQRLARK